MSQTASQKPQQTQPEGLAAPPLLAPLLAPCDAITLAENGQCACGQAALAAALQLDVADVLQAFPGPGLWVQESRMIQAIRNMSLEAEKTDELWSTPRVIMLQGLGTWMRPGVPMGARNQRSHWIATALVGGAKMVYDINLNDWVPVAHWRRDVMDEMLRTWKAQSYEVRAVFVARANTEVRHPEPKPKTQADQ